MIFIHIYRDSWKANLTERFKLVPALLHFIFFVIMSYALSNTERSFEDNFSLQCSRMVIGMIRWLFAITPSVP